MAVGICNKRSEENDGNYPLVLARSRTLAFHTIAVAPSDVKVIILQVPCFLFIYLFTDLFVHLFIFFEYALCTKE